MNQSYNMKIDEEIERMINCIHNNVSNESKETLHNFARQVIANEIKTSIGSNQDVQVKIATKVEKIHNRHSAKLCKNILYSFLKNNTFQSKREILETLLELSQQTDKDIPEMFQNRNNLMISQQTKFTYHSQRPNEKQQIMKRNRNQTENFKSDLIRELFFVFTNTHSQQIKQNDNGYVLKTFHESQSLMKMTSDIADVGWLHHKIVSYSPKEGIIRRALVESIQQQLKQFYIWNSTIQTLIKNSQISMRKLYILSFHPLEILKWLAIIIEAVQPFDGCHIISIINFYRPSGISAVDKLINRLIAYLMHPLLNYVKNWMYMGELTDKRNEFFIRQNKQVSYSQQWQNRFQLVHQNIPNILSHQSACMIFNTGKSLYFLRNVCKINYNIKTPFMELQDVQDMVEQNSSTVISVPFMNWLKVTYNEVNKTLVQTLFARFNLKYHLLSMRHFFLTGKGDFIQHLYDSLKEKLSQKNKEITQRSLHGYISDGIVKCFPDFKLINQENYFRSQIVERLLPTKIHFGNSNASQGWDFFNFQYSLQKLQPLYNIFSHEAMINYQKIFSFLWKVKQIKQVLKQLWVLQSREGSLKIKRSRNKFIYEISHYVYLLRNSMSHFITNLDSYLMVTIESTWNHFWQQIQFINTFDDIIRIHSVFQQQILQITLRNRYQQDIQKIINNIFISIANFKAAYLQLLQQIDDYYHKLREYEDKLPKSKRSLAAESFSISESGMEKSFKQIKQVRACFDQGLRHLYMKISNEKQSNLKILKAKINFSEYYSCLFMQ